MNKQKCEFCEFAQMMKDNGLNMQPYITIDTLNHESACYFHYDKKLRNTAKFCPYCGRELA